MDDAIEPIRAMGELVFLLQGARLTIAALHGRPWTGRHRRHCFESLSRLARHADDASPSLASVPGDGNSEQRHPFQFDRLGRNPDIE